MPLTHHNHNVGSRFPVRRLPTNLHSLETMAELHRPSLERQRLWGSLKRRFSESRASRRRLSIDDMKDQGSESALPLFDDQDDTDVHNTRTRQRSGDKVHRKYCTVGKIRNDSRVVIFPPIFCTRKSRVPEDDETCSTKPSVGLAARYNQQFTHLWLAESVRSKVTESTERTSSLPSPESSCQSPVRTDRTKDRSFKPQLQNHLSSETVVPPAPVYGGLVGEISRLSKTLDRASIDNHAPPRCTNRQVCDLDANTVASHTSSDLTRSEFSYADFGHKSEIDSTDSGKETTIEDIFQQHANKLLNIYDYSMSQGQSGQARGSFENKALWAEAVRLARKTNLSPVSQVDREKAEGTELAPPPLGFDPVLAGSHAHDDIMMNEGFPTQDVSQGDREKAEGTELAPPPLGLDPVLAGSHEHDDIMMNEGFPNQDVSQGDREKAEGTELAPPPLGFDPVLVGSQAHDDIMMNEGFPIQDFSYCQYKNPNQPIPDAGCVLDAQAIFRHLNQRDRQRTDWLEDHHDYHNILADPDDDWEDMLIQEICLSQDESHILSELTDNTVSYAEHLGAGDHATGGVTHHPHGAISKKAPCFVFYNEAYPADSEAFRISAARASLPVKVKDVITRIEELKRLEAYQAERFGFKGFIPIQDQSITESVPPAGPTAFGGPGLFTESEVSLVSTASF